MRADYLVSLNCLKGNGWEVTASAADRRGRLVLQLSREYEVGLCPRCGEKAMNNGFRLRTLWGPPWDRRDGSPIPIGLILRIQQYQCLGDEAHFWAQPTDDLPTGRITEALKDYILDHAFRTPFLTLKKWTGVGDKTVRRLFLEYIDELDRVRVLATPEKLAIHRQIPPVPNYTVVMNLEGEAIADVLEDQQAETLRAFLSSTFNVEDVKVVCIDPNADYRKVIRATLPSAQIVVPVNIVREIANREFRALMAKLGRVVTLHADVIQEIAVVSDTNDLSHLSANLGATLLSHHPLMKVCTLWHRFFSIWDAHDVASARKMARSWRKDLGDFDVDLPELVEVMGCDEDELYTEYNLSVEISNYLKDVRAEIIEIMGAGRGYDFKVFRGKLLYSKDTLVRWPSYQVEEDVFGLILDLPVIEKLKHPICGVSLAAVIEDIRSGHF
jgi:transposase